MQRIKIGVTSPLLADEPVLPDTGVMQHCNILERAGAEPIVLRNDMAPLSLVSELELFGLVFSGGGDIAAGTYGGDESRVRDDVDFRRDAFEFALLEQALAVGLPILATCRGLQVINVVLGGTLIEDLAHEMGPTYRVMHDQVRGAKLPYNARVHDIILREESLLYDIVGLTRFPVNSIHHQAIRQLGNGLQIVGHAEDGVIEAVEFMKPQSFFIGVQWHPEWLPEDMISRRLYARLISEARRLAFQGFRDVPQSGGC